MKKTEKLTEGLFYVVRFPSEWSLMTLSLPPGSDICHADYWLDDGVFFMDRYWYPEVFLEHPEWFPDRKLFHDEIGLLPYGFPRGRAVNVDGQHIIYHGDDLEDCMDCTRASIESSFGIEGRAKWVYDEHERCLAHDRDRLRTLLEFPETWKACSHPEGAGL